MSSFPAELSSSTPPAPPPKGSSLHGGGPPATASSPSPFSRPLPGEDIAREDFVSSGVSTPPPAPAAGVSDSVSDPGEGWLPETQDLADLLSSPALIDALAHAPSSAHESTRSSHALLAAALQHNSHLATQLSAAASRLSHQRSTTQAQLLATHALERQWRQKQADMDHALAPFSPASLYQQLGQGVQEQGYVCEALEESFLEGERGDGAGAGEERDLAEWVRRYREARVLWYLRRERRERWDEGRVGGWR
ncbi:hypothetical protein E4U43_008080 [Claviceps pusilla]|uniref:VPS37 C-terminal domain-containing protein n=1 Tax=Claviceps pusilla TaxID=123648 RepID=A0A9P7NIJ1_9HYPO|nr:hypothetical protein E4U43_008080 [Claviceps pusilla]